MKHKKHARKKTKGFTIIEVLIVLSIAGLILLIVLLAVPALNRTYRNYSRRHFVDFVASQLDNYRNSQGTYPGDGNIIPADNRCSYISSFLSGSSPVTCSIGADSIGQQCAKATINNFMVCYHDKNGEHDYAGPLDEISIEPGHICNPDNTAAELIISPGPTDNDLRRYAVWTTLEGANRYCVDDAYSH